MRCMSLRFAGSRRRPVVLVSLTAVLAASLAACSQSGSGGSVADRANTVAVCAQVAADVKDATVVAEKVASGQTSHADAATQLQPIAAKVRDLASKNSGLPVGHALTTLSDSITSLQKLSPSDAAGAQAAVSKIGTDLKAVLSTCTAAGT